MAYTSSFSPSLDNQSNSSIENKVIDNSTKPPRYLWPDWIKTVGIIIIVLAHVLYICIPDHPVLRMVSYGLSVFFFLAGYFHKREDSKIFFTKNIKSLLIPYIGYYIFNYIAWIIGTFYLTPEIVSFKELVIKPFIGFLLGNGISTDFSTAVSPPLWFFTGFFAARTIAFYLIKPNSTFLTVLYCILICILGYSFYSVFDFQIFSAISAIMAYPFIVIGHLFKKYRIIEKLNKYSLVPFSILFYAATYYISIINKDVVDFNILHFGENIGFFYLGEFTFLLACLFLAYAFSLAKIKFLVVDFISKSTIMIMGLQGIALRIIFLILSLTSPTILDGNIHSMSFRFGICILITFMVIILLIPFIILIAKKAPYLTGKS